jgi:Fe-S-cluster containining protein
MMRGSGSSRSSVGALRSEVHREGAALRDTLTGHLHPLNPASARVLDVLEDGIAVDDPVAAVERRGFISRGEAERELRQLMLLGLLEGSCATFRRRLAHVTAGEAPAPRVLSGSRFACQHSGGCCRGYLFGPISADEKERIEALRPKQALPALAGKTLFEPLGNAGGTRSYRLGTAGDACVFLEPDSRCGLHRAFGAEAKPRLCRLFPLGAVATIDGLKIYDRGECATFAVSATSGTTLGEDLPRILDLVDPELHHPVAHLHGSWRCDYGLVLRLADRLDAEAAVQPPLDALHAIGHITRGFITALARCPLQAGEPEATSAAALGRSARECRPPEAHVSANGAAGLEKLALLAQALAARVAPADSAAPVFVAAVTVLSELCAHLRDRRPMSQSAAGALSASIDRRLGEPLTLSLRHQLYGRELLLDDRLEAGLLRIALGLLIALAGARAQAALHHRPRPTVAQLSLAHMIAMRTLHRPVPRALLLANGAQVWPILDALPLLAPPLG